MHNGFKLDRNLRIILSSKKQSQKHTYIPESYSIVEFKHWANIHDLMHASKHNNVRNIEVLWKLLVWEHSIKLASRSTKRNYMSIDSCLFLFIYFKVNSHSNLNRGKFNIFTSQRQQPVRNQIFPNNRLIQVCHIWANLLQ